MLSHKKIVIHAPASCVLSSQTPEPLGLSTVSKKPAAQTELGAGTHPARRTCTQVTVSHCSLPCAPWAPKEGKAAPAHQAGGRADPTVRHGGRG